MAQCVSNRCKGLFERKKDFGVRGTLTVFNILIGHNSNVRTEHLEKKITAKKRDKPIGIPSKIFKDIPGCGPGARVGPAK